MYRIRWPSRENRTKPSTLTVWQTFVSDEALTISENVDSRLTVLATRVAASTRVMEYNFFFSIQLDFEDSEAVALRQWTKDNAAKIAEIAKGLHVNESEGNTQENSSPIENTRTVLSIAALGLQAICPSLIAWYL
ncbi:hypothetical protein KSS87_003542 [Heliosperma pusillum]|nr:hypothetical protein KSS87_003542 [Heliosperma pusillum]